jgi:hypothetical protein
VCPIKTEAGPCTVKAEAFCLYITEHKPCLREGPLCPKFEVAGPCFYVRENFCFREMCLREMPGLGCARENVFTDPWSQIVIPKGDPAAQPMIAKRNPKHVRPLTRQAPLSQKKFN